MSCSRKAAPIFKKFNNHPVRRGHPGYRQFSRVDVLTTEATETFHEPTCSHVKMMDQHVDPESDNEDDPTKLLNQWLGELNTLKKVVKQRCKLDYYKGCWDWL